MKNDKHPDIVMSAERARTFARKLKDGLKDRHGVDLKLTEAQHLTAAAAEVLGGWHAMARLPETEAGTPTLSLSALVSDARKMINQALAGFTETHRNREVEVPASIKARYPAAVKARIMEAVLSSNPERPIALDLSLRDARGHNVVRMTAFLDIFPEFAADVALPGGQPPAPPEWEKGEPVWADMHDDNYAAELKVDVRRWLATADIEEIVELDGDDWAFSSAADAVFSFYEDLEDSGPDEDVTDLVDAIRIGSRNSRNAVGFGVSVDGQAARWWLESHRPEAWQAIFESENPEEDGEDLDHSA